LCITWTSTSLAAAVVRRGRTRSLRYVYACGGAFGVVGMFAAVALVAGNLASNALHLAHRLRGYSCMCFVGGRALPLQLQAYAFALNTGHLQFLLARPARKVAKSGVDSSSSVQSSMAATQGQSATCKRRCGMSRPSSRASICRCFILPTFLLQVDVWTGRAHDSSRQVGV
jgi:hypothetical protein